MTESTVPTAAEAIAKMKAHRITLNPPGKRKIRVRDLIGDGRLNVVRLKIREGLDELDQGKGIPGEVVEAEMKATSKRFRSRK